MIDDNFQNDGEDGKWEQPDPEDVQKARDAADALVKAAQKLGLYEVNFDLGVAVGTDGSRRMTVIATFATGDITFSDRILYPEEADLNDEFITMRNAMDQDEFDAYKARLQNEYLGEVEDDGDSDSDD